MRELVDELRPTRTAISADFDWEVSPCEYQSSAAATRISFTNSVGDRRSADSAPSGTSKVIVGIGLASPASGYLVGRWQKTVEAVRCNGGAEAPFELLPIVSRELKVGCGGGI